MKPGFQETRRDGAGAGEPPDEGETAAGAPGQRVGVDDRAEGGAVETVGRLASRGR